MDCGIDGEHCRAEQYQRLEELYRLVVDAFSSMCYAAADGGVHYKAIRGGHMPQRTERRVRAAMQALAAEGARPYWQVFEA